MRLLTITLALFLITASAIALDRDTNKQTQKSAETSEVKQDAEKKVTKVKKSPTWPRPYKSTEEISVDSIVPFPTDI
jgi:hypothetical protein